MAESEVTAVLAEVLRGYVSGAGDMSAADRRAYVADLQAAALAPLFAAERARGAEEALREFSTEDRRDVAAWLVREADQRVKFFPQRRDGVDALLRHIADRLAALTPGAEKTVTPTRPWLMTYQGTRIDQSEVLWFLYCTVMAAGADEREVALAKKALYATAGAGGWDDICRDCPLHRYEHRGTNHSFISEEQ